MFPKMPDRITDDPRAPEDVIWPHERDEDAEYEAWKQRQMDNETESKNVPKVHKIETTLKED